MDRSSSNAITRMLGTPGIGRRTLAKAVGGGAMAGLITLPGFARAVARQGAASDHPAIVALSAAIEDAAASLDTPVTEIAVQSLEAVDWPDSCLGLAIEGEGCAEVITPGYRIVLGPPASGVVYRGDQHGTIRREATEDEPGSLNVRYEVTGGIAGIHDVFEVDTANLTDGEAAELRRLIAEADFWNLAEQIDDGQQIDDGFWFHVSVTEGSRQHTVSLIDTLGPTDSRYPRFWALLRWLDERTRQE
jgi:hypothetical protein